MKPVPAKYPYPYVGSWVLKGTGQGHPKMTLGLPVLITTCNLYQQIFHIFWHNPAYECRSASGQSYAQIPVAIWLLPSSIQLSARVPGPTPWLDLPRNASLEPQTFCRWCFRLSSTSPSISTSSVLPSFRWRRAWTFLLDMRSSLGDVLLQSGCWARSLSHFQACSVKFLCVFWTHLVLILDYLSFGQSFGDC